MANKDEYSMIRSMRLAGFLMYNGFKLINVSPNKDQPNKKVFWFENSEDLVLTIIKYNELNSERTQSDEQEKDRKALCRRSSQLRERHSAV